MSLTRKWGHICLYRSRPQLLFETPPLLNAIFYKRNDRVQNKKDQIMIGNMLKTIRSQFKSILKKNKKKTMT